MSFHAIDLISNATAIILSIKNLYLAHYIFRTILVAVRFIKGGKTLAIHKKTCLLHVYDKRTGLRLLFIVYCVMFKSKEKYNDKKRLQDIVLLTAISGCIIDIASGSS